jgi:SAM-dependent methyltransferase
VINKLIIDSTFSRTALCDLGVKYPTDKSPYNVGSSSGHRHAYTAVYDLLFSSWRNLPITLGEIGIEGNYSMMCWREYFPEASLVGWEYHPYKITKALDDMLDRTQYFFMDVTSEASISEGFSKPNCMFDIIIDDSTHNFEDQIRILKHVHRFIKPGGYFIIEDIFKSRPEGDYAAALEPLFKYYQSAVFVEADHENKDSGVWNNDKLLILVRNSDKR